MRANLIIDELFDFDETIPTLEEPESHSIPLPSIEQPIQSPRFAPPLSPFRRRSVEKYDLHDLPTNDSSHLSHANGVNIVRKSEREDQYPELGSSKPIAITPPPRSYIGVTPPRHSHIAHGLGIDDESEEEGMKEFIGKLHGKGSESYEESLLWDIPGDYYRSLSS
jgi:hypothetical protein